MRRFKVSFTGFERKLALLKHDKINIFSQWQKTQIHKHVYEENQGLYKHLGICSVFTLYIHSWTCIYHVSWKEKCKLQVKGCLLMLPAAALCIALMITTLLMTIYTQYSTTVFWRSHQFILSFHTALNI